ncbi:MAG: thiol-disulfide oxidoreductase DCC family protein [Rhodoluna sp.]
MSGDKMINPVLIFDGDCGFCTTTANFIERNSSVKVAIKPYQWADLDEFGLTVTEAAAKVQLVSGDKIFAGHHCMAKLLLIQRNPLLKLIGAVMVMPGVDPISAKVYDWVAANRQSLPGGTPACKLQRS